MALPEAEIIHDEEVLYGNDPRHITGTVPYSEIHAERIRAHKKHIANGHSMETEPWYCGTWWPVILEELGEVGRALNDGEGVERVRAELVQVAAMVTAWIGAIDRAGENVGSDSTPSHV